MCGISGILGPDGMGVPRDEVLSRLSSAMIHRGPDDHGLFRAPPAAFDARRLSIIDVEGGHQPCSDDTGRIVAIQNGEIYNHAELRSSLEGLGDTFTSRCDTEVIPHLYRRYGLDFAHKMRGMFAVAVWDGERDRAVLVRDRMGIKPLYYAVLDGHLLFASELKCLVASGMVPLHLNFEAISTYLELGYVPAPQTPLAAVSKLPAGHRLVVDRSGHRVERWWTYPSPTPGPTSLGHQHYAEGLLEELSEAVRYQVMSDVPLGVMLSGGLDSSLIVALMAARGGEQIKTFAVGLENDPYGNELAEARRVAETFGCDHHEVELPMASTTVDLPELVWRLDEPVADLSPLGFDALSRAAARDVTVALTGQGADELLGGYRKHHFAAALDRTSALRRIAGLLPTEPPAGLPDTWRRILMAAQADDPARRLLAMSGLPSFDGASRRGGLSAIVPGAALRSIRPLVRQLPPTSDALSATLFLDAQSALVDSMLLYFDRLSMAHSLEVRVPYLDHKVLEFCATIPSTFKVRGSVTKHVLKEAARGLLPADIINRKKIGFFRQAASTWFDAHVDGILRDVLLDPGARFGEFLDPAAVRGALEQSRRSGGEGLRRELIALLMLELWMARFLAPAAAGEVCRT